MPPVRFLKLVDHAGEQPHAHDEECRDDAREMAWSNPGHEPTEGEGGGERDAMKQATISSRSTARRSGLREMPCRAGAAVVLMAAIKVAGGR